MLIKFGKIMIIAAVAAFMATSCLDVDDEEEVYTAAEEIHLREAYIDSMFARGHDVDTTELGVYYITVEPGEGDFAKAGDTLTVGYAGYFIDGRLFDASEISSPTGKMTFSLEEDEIMPGPGWDDAMKVMNKNAIVQFIIPSELAYGDEWYGSIPPYQTLIYVVKLFEIQPS